MRPTEELLKGMLKVNPEERFSSEESLREFQSIFSLKMDNKFLNRT